MVSQVTEAVSLINQILVYVEDAESYLSSARTWGIFDALGGGLFTDIIKHSKVSKARNSMEEVTCLMQRLQRLLGSMQVPVDYRMEIGNFATFADFFFDGIIADVYMLNKIMQSLDTVRDLKHRLNDLKYRLENLR